MSDFIETLSDKQFPTFATFKYYRKYGLSLGDCVQGVQSACRFFGIPCPANIEDFTNKPVGGTMFINQNSKSYADDIIGFDLEELKTLSVNSKDAFTLIMTHECAHRLLQNTVLSGLNQGQWEEELCCDFFIGVRAIVEHVSIEALKNVCNGLSHSGGAVTHPTGRLRCAAIKWGCEVGNALIQNKQTCPMPELLGLFEKWRLYNASIIREEQTPFYGY